MKEFMHGPVRRDDLGAPRDELLESDVVDLAGMSITALRDLPVPVRAVRLLDEVRRERSNAMGGGNPPSGRAE
ncbi:aldo/keto reductase [Streptomyces sp. NPDC002004]